MINQTELARDEALEAWRAAVAAGETELGFSQWSSRLASFELERRSPSPPDTRTLRSSPSLWPLSWCPPDRALLDGPKLPMSRAWHHYMERHLNLSGPPNGRSRRSPNHLRRLRRRSLFFHCPHHRDK